ncbi:13829_t:CDS:2 [Acaulospora colombiana]|uniref:13829_t:CDS:1 n=1 Tax=Acaulospora colombiana TaxID=27376 RepID=A0ACA9KUX6_9GLOM|nr:13829_t:CDS:2 [Acaulospora colombiana]
MTSEITCERTLLTSYDFKSTSTTPCNLSTPNIHVSNKSETVFLNVRHEYRDLGDVEGKVNETHSTSNEDTRPLDVSSTLARRTSSLSLEDTEKKESYELLEDIRKRELDDTLEEHIIPFDSDLSTELRREVEYPHGDVFSKALSEAMERETEDNDGLPSESWALHKVVESPSKRRKLGRKKLARTIVTDEPNFGKDESLTIPGESVLAFAKDNKYYPARIVGYTEPNKYKVKFCDKTSDTIPRNRFYTKYEKGFQTCQDEKAWRYQHFIEGGKKRSLLAENVSPGPFDSNEFNMIMNVLISMFAPRIAKSINNLMISTHKNREANTLKRSKEMPRQDDEARSTFNSYSDDLQLRFINDVLLPETIIRLIMEYDGIDYEAADNKMLTGYKEERWVENLMAERESFQVGRESLHERHK